MNVKIVVTVGHYFLLIIVPLNLILAVIQSFRVL